MEEEELKDDILDLKTLHKEEKLSIPFEEYLKARIKHRKEAYRK